MGIPLFKVYYIQQTEQQAIHGCPIVCSLHELLLVVYASTSNRKMVLEYISELQFRSYLLELLPAYPEIVPSSVVPLQTQITPRFGPLAVTSFYS